MNARIARELENTLFIAVNLGSAAGLVEVGSAEVESDGRDYHVTASVLGDDGYCGRYTLPDVYQHEWQAQKLADSLNTSTVCDL